MNTHAHIRDRTLSQFPDFIHLFNFYLFKKVVCHSNESLTLILSTFDFVVMLLRWKISVRIDKNQRNSLRTKQDKWHQKFHIVYAKHEAFLCDVCVCVSFFISFSECFWNLIIISVSIRKIMNAQCIFIENRFGWIVWRERERGRKRGIATQLQCFQINEFELKIEKSNHAKDAHSSFFVKR